MSEPRLIKYQSEIPAAPWYVTMNDAFMSGWGGAGSKIASYIYPCASFAEAEAVAGNARARTDQKRVAIVSGHQPGTTFQRRPRLQRGHVYQVVTREQAPSWYEPGAFAARAAARKAAGGKGRKAPARRPRTAHPAGTGTAAMGYKIEKAWDPHHGRDVWEAEAPWGDVVGDAYPSRAAALAAARRHARSWKQIPRRGGKPRAAVGAGVWQPEEIGGFWHVVNQATGQKVKVGRVGGPRGNLRGINYYDRACQEARRRNGGVDYAWQINNPGWKASQCAPGVPAARLGALADAVRKLVR